MKRKQSFSERRACVGKVRFASMDQAKAERDRLKAARPVKIPGKHLEAYRCRFCRLYHVGNTKDEVALPGQRDTAIGQPNSGLYGLRSGNG